jgi:hypothetical protein
MTRPRQSHLPSSHHHCHGPGPIRTLLAPLLATHSTHLGTVGEPGAQHTGPVAAAVPEMRSQLVVTVPSLPQRAPR